jgi:dUTP pyrophosphatase
VKVRVRRAAHADGLPLPRRASPGSAGWDLRAAVGTGLHLEIPPGWEAQVRPRSGLALAHGVTVVNAPGTIDSDYRGEVRVLLVNLGGEPYAVSRGDRVAQLVFSPVHESEWEESGELADSERGDGGFGSTGRR